MNILVITYWSFNEPLTQAATLPYLSMMKSASGEDKVHLMTLEKEQFIIPKEEEAAIRVDLEAQGIQWIHKKYHKFGLRAMLAFSSNLLFLMRYCRKHKIDVLHAFGSPAATSAHLLHRLTGIKYVIDSYEPHAESMVENGSWRRNSLAYILLKNFEHYQARKATAVVATTDGMKDYAAKTYGHIPAAFVTKPACVDLNLFKPTYSLAISRSDLQIPTEDRVCVYAGKVGGIYLREEIFDFFDACHKHWNGAFSVLLLSDMQESEMLGLLEGKSIPREKIHLKFAPHAEVPNYLALADFAINPVKPVPSKRYCTSIKDGEYWAMGLPVVIPAGISDDSDLIRKEQIGVVLDELNTPAYEKAAASLDQILQRENPSLLRNKIRQIAHEKRGLHIAEYGYQKLYGPGGILRESISNFLVLIYNSYKDPLFQNLMYEYLTEQTERHHQFRFDLITFEQKQYALSAEAMKEEKALLTGKRVYWHPLTYHSGSFMFIKKSIDFGAALIKVLSISLKKRPSMILAFANASAAISYLLSRITRSKLMVYSFEPHSEFLAEFGIWRKNGWRYKILNSLEDKVAEKSDYILTGTRHMKEDLKGKANGLVLRAPSSVDPEVFRFLPNSRERIRKELGLEGRKVMVYAGKFGGIYYEDEIGTFCASLLKQDPSWYFIFLTPSPKDYVEKILDAAHLSTDAYHLHEAKGAHEVAEWLSASDIGLTAIPPYPFQRYRSPVKVGEYLMCGLPYITCAGVSEDDEWAIKEKVGIVVDALDETASNQIQKEAEIFFAEDPTSLRNRCRETGIAYRGRAQVDEAFERCLLEA